MRRFKLKDAGLFEPVVIKEGDVFYLKEDLEDFVRVGTRKLAGLTFLIPKQKWLEIAEEIEPSDDDY